MTHHSDPRLEAAAKIAQSCIPPQAFLSITEKAAEQILTTALKETGEDELAAALQKARIAVELWAPDPREPLADIDAAFAKYRALKGEG